MTTDVLKVSGNYIIDAGSGDITLNTVSDGHTGTIFINGNLTVVGTQSSINTIDSQIRDNLIVLNSGETHSFVSAGVSGIQIARGFGDSLSNSATFLYDDGLNWTDSAGLNRRGQFRLDQEGVSGCLRVGGIRIASTATSLNFLGAENPNAVLSVKGTVAYEDRVVDNDDIPNKLYVDRAVINNVTTAQKLRVGGSFIEINDNDVAFDNPFYSTSDKIFVCLSTNTNRVFLLEGTLAKVQGVDINRSTITGNLGEDLVLGGDATRNVKFTTPVSLQTVDVQPEAVVNQVAVYSTGTVGGGGTGVYVVNNLTRDEIASRRRAMVYGLIF